MTTKKQKTVNKICTVCGKEYQGASASKYCSESCRRSAQKIKRQDWETETDYKSRLKLQAEEEAREIFNRAKEEARQDIKREKAAKAQRKRRANAKSLYRARQDAASGDLLANMRLAESAFTYWQYYQEFVLQEEKRTESYTNIIIGGIDIHRPDFPALVCQALEDRKKAREAKGQENEQRLDT